MSYNAVNYLSFCKTRVHQWHSRYSNSLTELFIEFICELYATFDANQKGKRNSQTKENIILIFVLSTEFV